jgi:heme/copper-type cytochrome/quinol oxidase subunit 2
VPSASQTAAADVTVTVNIADGKVTPNGAGVRVDVGQTVQVSATSDIEEALHIHGYDKTLDVTPGRPSTVIFVADQSGVFEIETHDSGKLVAKLIVS